MLTNEQIEKERHAFEAWQKQKYAPCPSDLFNRSLIDKNKYLYERIQDAWEGWLGRASTSTILISIPEVVYEHSPDAFIKLRDRSDPDGLVDLAETIIQQEYGGFNPHDDSEELEVLAFGGSNEIEDMLNSQTNSDLSDSGIWFVI